MFKRLLTCLVFFGTIYILTARAAQPIYELSIAAIATHLEKA